MILDEVIGVTGLALSALGVAWAAGLRWREERWLERHRAEREERWRLDDARSRLGRL